MAIPRREIAYIIKTDYIQSCMAGVSASSETMRPGKEGPPSCPAPLLCQPFARRRHGFAHHPEIAGAQQPRTNGALSSRIEAAFERSRQSA
jgi:hypothetical protein